MAWGEKGVEMTMMEDGLRLERGSVGFPPPRGFFIWRKRRIEETTKGPVP